MKEKFGALREWMLKNGLFGLVVPRADKYLGEYVSPADERLAWLTGFTGSAGEAVILLYPSGAKRNRPETDYRRANFGRKSRRLAFFRPARRCKNRL